jgi:uncharacterized protein
VNFSEQAITFNCAHEALVGILTEPEAAICSVAVIVIVGGPQYRVGSHRQFVLLSRALAAGGYPVLRFDYRGMGDSSGALQDFSEVTKDIGAAIDVMQRKVPSIVHVALWGLCDAASASLLYCHDSKDPRVCGLCLLNPWVRSEVALARTHVKHYYAQRLRQREFWLKLLSGKVALSATCSLWKNLALALRSSGRVESNSTPQYQRRMAEAWKEFNGEILLLLSGKDYTAKEFLEFAGIDSAWNGLLERPNVIRRDLADADHTFAQAAMRKQVEGLTMDWLAHQIRGYLRARPT